MMLGNYASVVPTDTIAGTDEARTTFLDITCYRAAPFANANEPGSPTDVDTDDDLVTPQSPSPSPSSRSARGRMQAGPFVSLQSAGRKRPSDYSNSDQSPNLTKTMKGKQAVKAYIEAAIPTPPLFKKPALRMACSFQTVASGVSSVNTSFSNTASSSQQTNTDTVNTSFASIDGSSDLDIARPKMARTSSVTISSLEEDSLLNVVSAPHHEGFDVGVQRDRNQLCSQELSRRSGSTFGSIDEDDLYAVSCQIQEEARLGIARDAVIATGESPSKFAYYIRNLPQHGLFVDDLPENLLVFPFFMLFICCRLSINNGISMEELMSDLDCRQVCSSSVSFWNTVGGRTKIPNAETDEVWTASKKAFEGFTFKGRAVFNGWSGRAGCVFKLDILPICYEKSCLLQRMYGSDRFLYLTFPSFSDGKPERFSREQMAQIEKQWKLWITQTHNFLGRRWQVFYIEPTKKKSNTRSTDTSDKRVILFATEGVGLETIGIGKMINRFFNFFRNKEQNFCKAFARLELALSRTIPTLVFKPSQIIRIRDRLSDQIPEASDYDDPDLPWTEQIDPDQVMTDGCARISVGAAMKIWEIYRSATGATGPLPSAFQGRIGGAKGMWTISGESYTREQAHQEIWIEISGSQLKFEPSSDNEDDDLYDPHMLTFNYVKHSFVNGSTDLHMSFIPILLDRGVKKEAMANLIIDRLNAERKQLLELIHNPVKLHNWVVKQGPATLALVTWEAGLPLSLAEKVKLLLRSGFTPDHGPYLAKCLISLIRRGQTTMEQKLRAPLGKATFLLGVADPEGVLEPGQVHVRFSSTFVDEYEQESYNQLDGFEILVARQPACRRSDIQKVRAISHPKLAHLVDVIVFPVHGEYPLAGKLQGGDYDGDTFWTCWEPVLVEPFRNAPSPFRPPDPADYGIVKDERQLLNVMKPCDLSSVDGFLKAAFDFRTSPSLLGRATNFHEKVSYRENRIFSAPINALCDVHDLLVDASKQGYRLSDVDFNELIRNKLKCGNPRVPAYKQGMEISAKGKDTDEGDKDLVENLKYKPSNILDYLYFDILRKHNRKTCRLLTSALPKEQGDDAELQLPFQQLRDTVGILGKELQALQTGFESILRIWNSNTGDRSALPPEKFGKLVRSCYTTFQSLAPSPTSMSDPAIAPLLCRYLGPTHPTTWEMVRASALYTAYPKKHSFVWHMAGRELAMLKARANPDTYHIVPSIFADLKVKPNKAPRPVEADESEDEFESALEQIPA